MEVTVEELARQLNMGDRSCKEGLALEVVDLVNGCLVQVLVKAM